MIAITDTANSKTAGKIYLSKDGGISWFISPGTPANKFFSLATSDTTGQYLSVIGQSLPLVDTGIVYYSSDYGNSWTAATLGTIPAPSPTLAPTPSPYNIDIIPTDYTTVATAQTKVIGSCYGSIFVSSGASFALSPSDLNAWATVPAGIYASNVVMDNFGNRYMTLFRPLNNFLKLPNTTTTNANNQWEALSGINGSYLSVLAVDQTTPFLITGGFYNDYLYYSLDEGTTWTQFPSSPKGNWIEITCGTTTATTMEEALISIANNCETIFALTNTSLLYQSTNRGDSWQSITSPSKTLETVTFVTTLDTTSVNAPTDTLVLTAGLQTTVYLSQQPNQWTSYPPFSANWTAIAVDASGQYAVAATVTGTLYYTTNYGQLWQPTVSTGLPSEWVTIVSDITGRYVVAIPIEIAEFYLSSDYGMSYTRTLTAYTWNAIAMKPYNFKTLFGASGNTFLVSYNAGNSWTKLFSFPTTNPYSPEYIRDFAVNDNFTIIALILTSPISTHLGTIYYSHNGGISWAPAAGASYLSYYSIIGDSTGSTFLATSYDASGGVYLSQTQGTTWSKTDAKAVPWAAIAGNRNLSVIVAARYGVNPLYISTDLGNTWSTTGNVTEWGAMAVCESSLFYAGGWSGPISTSNNDGKTWQFSAIQTEYTSLTVCNYNNSLIAFAVADRDSIVYSINQGVTWMNISSTPWNCHWTSITCSSILSGSATTTLNVVATSWDCGVYMSTNAGQSWYAAPVSTSGQWANDERQ